MREKKQSLHIKKPGTHGKKHIRGNPAGPGLTAFLVILLAAAAVLTGLSLPGLSTAIQSRNVDKLNRQEELGAGTLRLASDEKMLEKLRLVCLDYEGGEYETVTLENGRFLSRSEAESSIGQLSGLIAGTGLYGGEDTGWKINNCEPFLLIPRSGDIPTAIIWLVEAEQQSGGEDFYLQLLTDDETGIVLAACLEGRTGGDTDHRQALDALGRNLKSCCGFQNTDFVPPREDEMDINKYYYFIHCIEDGQQVFDIPVSISPFGWQIGGSGGVYAVEEAYTAENTE